MAFETELKLAIAAQDVPALLAHPLLAAEPSQRQRLVSTYFDTQAHPAGAAGRGA
jgi:triphosphatase